MVCHYCGRKVPVPAKCPECGSRYIKYFGIGTEQVEEAVKQFFPRANTARLDLDAVKNRRALDIILGDFSKKKTDILIGTQMVAKGLDFDNVGVVGVIAADVTLNIPDYRSAERTFQLVTQVAGRAGRGSRQGLVVVQTYDPDNYALKAAAAQDYGEFFRQEIALRKYMEYPPFGDIIMANLTSEKEDAAKGCAERCRAYMEKESTWKVLSPKVALSFKGKESFRYYVLIKCPKTERNRCVFYLDNFSKILLRDKVDCVLGIDVNPYSFF